MPNAGGRGQCLDCPRKALLPSQRCSECQLRLLRGAPMADLHVFQQLLERRLEAAGSRARPRLEALFELLRRGEVGDALQAELRSFAEELTTSRPAAQRRLQQMIAQHWQQHKYWLQGLKWLL